MGGNKIKAKYKSIVRNGHEYKPIIEINNVDSDGRMCNCCKSHKGIRQDLSLGCDNYSVSVCICEQCLIILHDMIGEYLEKGGE